MSKKLSMVDSSKYEHNPEQFEKDIQTRISYKKQFKNKIRKLILSKPDKMDTHFRYALDTLKE